MKMAITASTLMISACATTKRQEQEAYLSQLRYALKCLNYLEISLLTHKNTQKVYEKCTVFYEFPIKLCFDLK